jgi:hypothetical protein
MWVCLPEVLARAGLRQSGRDCRKSASGCRKCRFAALWLPFFRSAVSQLRQRPVVVSGRDPAWGPGVSNSLAVWMRRWEPVFSAPKRIDSNRSPSIRQ